ncbi:MAG TPA: hypothetical protein VIX91_17410 [Candidatus Acidoferrum sp.]
MGKVPKVTLMIQCKVDGIWKKLPAPMSANGRPKNVLGATTCISPFMYSTKPKFVT